LILAPRFMLLGGERTPPLLKTERGRRVGDGCYHSVQGGSHPADRQVGLYSWPLTSI